MNKEEALSLLKKYPPIVEIRTPKVLHGEEIQRILEKVRSVFGEGTLVFIIPIPDLPLDIINPSRQEELLNDFIGKWREAISVQPWAPLKEDNPIPTISTYDFIVVHSVLKDGEELFKEKVSILQEAMKKLAENGN